MITFVLVLAAITNILCASVFALTLWNKIKERKAIERMADEIKKEYDEESEF